MNRFKECREKRGYSQQQLCIMLGLKGSSVSNWESGKTKPNRNNLQRLARLYGVSMDYLLGEEEKEKTAESSNALRVPVLGSIPAGVQ